MLQYRFDVTHDRYCGNLEAPIELVEYGDFQCKKSAGAFAEIKMLQDILGSKIIFVYRHFPMANLHPLSLETAIACEAAAAHNKFWNMHDMLFHNQERLSRVALLEFADGIGMEPAIFEAAREEESTFKKVVQDFDSGIQSGVTTTPAFFINGFHYTGKADFKHFYSICQHILILKTQSANGNEILFEY